MCILQEVAFHENLWAGLMLVDDHLHAFLVTEPIPNPGWRCYLVMKIEDYLYTQKPKSTSLLMLTTGCVPLGGSVCDKRLQWCKV